MDKKKLKTGYLISILLFLLVLAGVIAYFYVQIKTTNCTPAGCVKTPLTYFNEPQYKKAKGYSTGSTIYGCSKEIELVSKTKDGNGKYINFLPVDAEEAGLFCHTSAAIEYKGKLTVLQKPEVLSLISKYEYKDVSIKALEFEYIQDKDFVHKLLPQFSNKEIGCIIILETPNEKLVFLEDEELETFEQMDYKLFEEQLNGLSAADRNLFLENLN